MFVEDHWAEGHHDFELMDHCGRPISRTASVVQLRCDIPDFRRWTTAVARWQDRIQNAVISVGGRGDMPEIKHKAELAYLRALTLVRRRVDMTGIKHRAELAYWRSVSQRESGKMTNDHYAWFYTSNFGLSPSDYDGRRILDIGCGPRGSLEWADMASERVGLDPLVDEYQVLGIGQHKMNYVRAGSESIPFPDGHFDFVTSFNSLDHVDDVDATIVEITRVTAPAGLLLLMSDIGHDPTFTEPLSFSWDIIDRFTDFNVIESRHLEKSLDGVYASVKAAVPYDHADPRKRYGIISAKLQRR